MTFVVLICVIALEAYVFVELTGRGNPMGEV